MGEIGNVEQLPLHNLPSTASGPELSLQVINVAASSMREMQIAATSTSMGVYDSSDSSGYLSEINPQEAWLPITESRNGSTVTCVFHLLSSGIGIQALLLPVAFSTLGWAWGIICLSLAFTWQLYTIWVLVQLHESVPGIGTRYSRYLQLAIAAFGPKLGKLLAIFPVMYLSGGSCVLLIIRGAGTMELFFKMMLGGEATSEDNPLAGAGWFLVFTCMAIALAQRPNLNSIAGFSLIGAVTAIAYCTLIWALPISKGRPTGVSYNSQKEESGMSEMFDVLNAIGMIALAFRGHNLGTLPSSSKCPSKKQMWRGVTLSYIIIAMCLFPVAIAGFWAYGNKDPQEDGGPAGGLAAYYRIEKWQCRYCSVPFVIVRNRNPSPSTSSSFRHSRMLYTIWILVQLHEPIPGIRTRYSRYLQLAIAAFGPKLGKLLAIFPVMYLSGSTCIMLIIKGAGVTELLFKLMCEGGATCDAKSLTGAEWFLVFTCMAIALAQRPNLNSIAGFSLAGAMSGIGYCTLIWALPISKDRPSGVSYDSRKGGSSVAGMFDVLNAIGIIMLAFRGHNLVLEIQGTLPSSLTNPSKRTMWRGVSVSYTIIAICQFPLAIAGFWAYGNKIPSNGGMLTAFMQFHGRDTSRFVKGLVYLLVVINCLSSFQIYAMPVFDNLEFRYISMKNRRCPWWVRSGFRLFFGGMAFFIAVALPFLPSLAPLVGGITLPLTLAYPCFMWILIKKPHQKGHDAVWCLNLGLGCLGIVLSVLLVVAAARNLAIKGLHASFFKPQ
ncbi:hypothetical protein NC651_011527 [Populus alba x Populus x berolinensis]|nr:hypothetical protein NC651_011527 [Populus alba x Populus x berolinensis]